MFDVDNKEIRFCKEDIAHNVRFFGTGFFGNGRTTPTPVEIFTFTGNCGILDADYLEQFPPGSEYYEEIQNFKSSQKTSEGLGVKAQ